MQMEGATINNDYVVIDLDIISDASANVLSRAKLIVKHLEVKHFVRKVLFTD